MAPREVPYRVTLTCGHTFKVSDRPQKWNRTYSCKYQAGCGYRLNWVEYTDTRTDFTILNDRIDQ